MSLSRKQIFQLFLLMLFDLSLILFRNFFAGGSLEQLASLENIITFRSQTFLFLIWNLFLAAIPLGLALVLHWYKHHPRFNWIFWPGLALWLVFFPNAPYIITDLIHIRPRPYIPLWYDTFTFFVFAWSGLYLGLLSIKVIGELLVSKLGNIASQTFIFSAIMLSGFGIAVGRFLRWNSWDIIANPSTLFQDTLSLITNPGAYKSIWGMAVLFSLFLAIAYLLSNNPMSCEKKQ